MARTIPDTWAWDDYDILIPEEDEVAARHAQIIVEQVESFDAEALPWDPDEKRTSEILDVGKGA